MSNIGEKDLKVYKEQAKEYFTVSDEQINSFLNTIDLIEIL